MVRPRSRRARWAAHEGTTGQLLRRRRLALELTQAHVAGLLGLHQSVVSRVEGGAITLTLDDLCEWASALNADPITLLSDDGREASGEVRRPRDRSLRRSTRFARSVPPEAVDAVASVNVSVRTVILAQRSRAWLLPGDARALIRAGFADPRSLQWPERGELPSAAATTTPN